VTPYELRPDEECRCIVRRAGGFTGRIDDIVVPLPPGTSYTTELEADLFGGQGLKPFTSRFEGAADVSAMLEAMPISTINSGQEDLRLVKVWTGKLVSPPIRVPADCSKANP
jgi:hypothetical protein